jgi:hypothetical protein
MMINLGLRRKDYDNDDSRIGVEVRVECGVISWLILVFSLVASMLSNMRFILLFR